MTDQIGGIPWRFDAKTTRGDPGGGGLSYNAKSADETTVICVSHAMLGKRNPDVSQYVATWDAGGTADNRGTLVITSATRDTVAIFTVKGTATHKPGYSEIPVTPVQSFDAFENREAITVQFSQAGEIIAPEPGNGTPSADVSALQAQIVAIAAEVATLKDQVSAIQQAMAALVIEASKKG